MSTGRPTRVVPTTSCNWFEARSACTAGTGRTYTRRLGDPSAVTLDFSYQGGVTVRISAAELGNTKVFKFFVFAATGCTVDPTARILTAATHSRIGARWWRRPLPVRGQDHAADAGREEPEADSQNPTAGRSVHAPARRGTLRHGRSRPERTGHLCRTPWKRTTQGTGSACAGRGGDLHVEPSTDREGQDLPRIGGDRVRGPEGL